MLSATLNPGFRNILVMAAFCVIASCGQKKQPSVQNPKADSAAVAEEEPIKLPHADRSDREEVDELSSALTPFVPEGYTVLDTATGNLNLDQYPDAILVLKKDGEDSTSDVERPEARPLLVLTGQADNTYKLAARGDSAVYCVNCGGMMGDPFTGVVIKNGYFSVEHYGGSGWRWTRIVTFKYSPADSSWYLHKDGGESYHVGNPEKSTASVKNEKDFGKVLLQNYSIFKEE